MSPLVSVIITTHNRAGVVPETIDSVLAQTYEAIEVIVVDDGSTDDTAAMLRRRYGDRVRYVRQENQGVEMARNRGIRFSTGDYLNFLDDDDLMLPEKIEKQVALLKARPEVGVVHCGYHFIDKDGRHMETTGLLPDGDVRKPLVWGCFPWSGGPLIRRECFDHIGEHEHRDWYGDWGMWLRFALAGYQWACAQEPLGCYRIVRGSMTDDKVANVERLILHILGAVFANWKLPDDILAEKDAIYAGWHFWIACRYYLGGFWDAGRRNLSAMLERRPEFLEHPDELLQLFYWDAVSPRGRVHEPIKFINDVFDHLPAIAAPIDAHRSKLIGQISAALAMRYYATGEIKEAQQHMNAAIARDASMLAQPDAFVRSVYEYAGMLPEQARLGYVDTVFGHLPDAARALSRTRSRVLGEVNVNRAFQEYHTGQRRAVPRRVLTALRYHPALIKNRGVVAIFARSLPALFSRRATSSNGHVGQRR